MPSYCRLPRRVDISSSAIHTGHSSCEGLILHWQQLYVFVLLLGKLLKLLKHRETNSAVARLCRRTGTSPRRKRHSNVAPASKCQTEWPRAFGAVATTPDHCTAQQPEQSNAMQFAPCDPPKSGEGLASLEVPPNGSDQSNEPEVRQLRLGLL